jgi:two-component system response regulator NreC
MSVSAKDAPGPQYSQPSIAVSRYTSGLPKVVVLNKYAFVSELLGLILSERIDVVGKTASGLAAVGLSELLSPDVIVAGEALTDGPAELFVPALLQTGARLLFLCPRHDLGRLLELVELGITGVVDSEQSPEELASAVLVLAAGGAVLPPIVVDSIAADWRRAKRRGTNNGHGSALTSRELEVLGAMSDGLSAKAVAHHLGIAVKTVENHKTRIFDKLGVRTQAQAVALAIGGSAQSARSLTRPNKPLRPTT